MKYTLRNSNSGKRRNVTANFPVSTNTTVEKVVKNIKKGVKCVTSVCAGRSNDKIVKKKVSLIQKIGDNMSPTVRLVDIGAVKMYQNQRKVGRRSNRKSNQETGNNDAANTTTTTTMKGTNKVTLTTSQVLKEKSLVNMQPVVRLVDCYESLFSLSAIIASASSSSASKSRPPRQTAESSKAPPKKRRGRPSRSRTPQIEPQSVPPIMQDLKSRGLQEFKLGDFTEKSVQNSGPPIINVKAITHLLVHACTSGNAPNRHNRPFDLEDPWEECLAITEALQIYAAHVTPEESLSLFESTSTSPSTDLLLPEVRKKTWQYLSTLGNSHFFFKMLRTPDATAVFENKMVGIMRAGVDVDAFNWTLTEVGSILGFWLAKLYNDRGISDDDLPLELNLAKQHFMELNGWEYDKAVVHDHPMN